MLLHVKSDKNRLLYFFIYKISLAVRETGIPCLDFIKLTFDWVLRATRFVPGIKDTSTQVNRLFSKQLQWNYRITWRYLEFEATLNTRVSRTLRKKQFNFAWLKKFYLEKHNIVSLSYTFIACRCILFFNVLIIDTLLCPITVIVLHLELVTSSSRTKIRRRFCFSLITYASSQSERNYRK